MKLILESWRKFLSEGDDDDQETAPDYPVSSAATIVFDEEGRVLILRRGKTAPWMPGRWSLPGGGIDPKESPKQAAVRETAEETSLQIQTLSHLVTIDYPEEGWAAAFFVSKAGEWSGEVELDYENDKYSWISSTEIKQYSFIPTVEEALMKAFFKKMPR